MCVIILASMQEREIERERERERERESHFHSITDRIINSSHKGGSNNAFSCLLITTNLIMTQFKIHKLLRM